MTFETAPKPARRPRLKPARIEDVVDGARLRAQLSASALESDGDESAARKRALDLLHGALFRGRMIAKERLEDGAGGHETARLLAQVADEVIAALFDYVATHVIRSRNPTEGERLAIVAVGGYGRLQLAPSSDIDLLFLRDYKQTPWIESVTEYMLYMLWDMGLKVGHSSRTLDECMKLAREDHTIQTALLEARFVAGDTALFEHFTTRYRKEVLDGGHAAFVQAKLKERDERHTRAGVSRYLVEPNVKESKGGLRDLHALFWILRHRYGWTNPAEYIKAGVFTRDEIALFLRASDFLWRVRCHLHFITGRAEERLTFDLQPEIAQRMGFGARANMTGVERFMKRYFLAAKDVGALTRIMAAKLAAESGRRAQFGLARFFPQMNRRAMNAGPGFRIEAGRVTLERGSILTDDPINLLRLFQIADERQLDIHPDALREVTLHLRAIDKRLRANSEAQKIFLGLLSSTNNPAASLRLMNEAGVLGRFLPEFGRIVAQMQFNMYHHYTVDEHTLRAVEVISEIEKGKFHLEHPLSTAIFPKIINRRALYLAMLLHDTGKGLGDQQEEGERTALAACRRLGVPEEESALVAWLVGHHLIMSDVAQKRDLGDPATIVRFAETVGTLERLRLLLVLTVADIRAVGPGVWNGWKGQLLRDLYRSTEAVFLGGRTDEAGVREKLAHQARETKAALFDALKPDAMLSQWLDSFDDAYWLSFEGDALAWHAEVASAGLWQEGHGGVQIGARVRKERGVTELLVYAPDRPGLFARIAAAFAAGGADISDARIHTTRDGRAFDVFSILDSTGAPFGHESQDIMDRMIKRVRAAIVSDEPIPVARQNAPRRAAAFAIEPWVRVDNDLSDTATVIEVSGRDRRGLLAELADVFAAEKVEIISAHIDSYGERVADVFYVTEHDGSQITHARRIGALKASLEAVLRDGAPDAPSDPAKQKLAVARASTGR